MSPRQSRGHLLQQATVLGWAVLCCAIGQGGRRCKECTLARSPWHFSCVVVCQAAQRRCTATSTTAAARPSRSMGLRSLCVPARRPDPWLTGPAAPGLARLPRPSTRPRCAVTSRGVRRARADDGPWQRQAPRATGSSLACMQVGSHRGYLMVATCEARTASARDPHPPRDKFSIYDLQVRPCCSLAFRLVSAAGRAGQGRAV